MLDICQVVKVRSNGCGKVRWPCGRADLGLLYFVPLCYEIAVLQPWQLVVVDLGNCAPSCGPLESFTPGPVDGDGVSSIGGESDGRSRRQAAAVATAAR